MMNAITAQPQPLPELLAVPIGQLTEHPLNARKHFDQAAQEELSASIRDKGIQTPLLVRENGKGYQIIAGARRFRSAKAIGLDLVPVLVRKLDDEAALELMLIDNLQREGLHPLEEAHGYQQLLARAKKDVAAIAEKVGRSVKYVYDRIKLLQLTKEMQQIFHAGEISAGHAIIIARLGAADQKRLLDEDAGGDYRGRHAPLFEDEETLFHPEDDEEEPTRKPISVRELQAWVDKNVRLEAAQADPMLFPETVKALKTAVDEKEKVVRITYDEITPDAAKDGPRPILGRSWKRADGKRGSKTCDRSVIGMIVIGPERGETLRVCTDKQGCAVHWKEHQKAAKRRQAETNKVARAGGDVEAHRRQKEKEERERQALEELRWKKAEPAVIAALAAAAKKASAGAGGVLGKLVLDACESNLFYRSDLKEASKLVSVGKSAEDLVRHIGFVVLLEELRDADLEEFADGHGKALGIDVLKIRDQAAPLEARCRKCGCTEQKACKVEDLDGEVTPCSWFEKPDPNTGLGLCSAPACVSKGRAKPATKKAKRKK